jgi:hypothetical protein
MANDKFETIATGLILGAGAAVAAASFGYIAHYDLGLSRQEIRAPALLTAGVIALLLAVEYFGKQLRKPK